MSQPAVSMQIKALEHSLGLPLFEKAGRRVGLTEAGSELLGYAERIFALMEETELVLDELRGARRGTVKVAASTTAGIYIVPALLGAFHRRNPGVRLTLDVVNRYQVQELLLNNEADLAIMGSIEDMHDLEVARFVPNDLVVTAYPGHRLADRKGVPLSELGGETLLLREGGSGTRTDVERLFAEAGVPINLGMELRSSGAIKQAVAAELGITVMPLSALELELATGRLITLDVESFPVRRYWSLVRRVGRHLSAAAIALWDFLLTYRDELDTESL
jgi:DNA-binding transcriptional LysR family regulator